MKHAEILWNVPLIMTVGHSTRSLEELIELLWLHEVTCVVDIRSKPHSRWHPHFNRDSLAKSLPDVDVAYFSMPELGGMREPRADSINVALTEPMVRGFADYMATEEFREALNALVEISRFERVAVLCSEAMPWKCHRFLLADALVMRGFCVDHILGPDIPVPHLLSPIVCVEDGVLTYPAEDFFYERMARAAAD